jgi:acyl carrier protein
MDEKTIRDKLRTFIIRDLILMDSFALAEFAVFVEKELGVYIPDADLTVAKMDTLDQMVARVMKG